MSEPVDVEALCGRRFRECVERFGIPDEYDPRCCRFPKSCSPYPYREAIEAGNVAEADLESLDGLPPYCRPCGFRHVGGAAAHVHREPADSPLRPDDRGFTVLVELANIRRLLERHGVAPADGHGVIRSTVGMVEEALIARPPSP